MQLIWLSGPTAKVVNLSIRRQTIVASLAGAALVLVLLGGALQWLGIRVAVDGHPGLARLLGGVTTVAEQSRIEQHYQNQIAQLRARVDGLAGKVSQLQSAKEALVQLMPPAPPRRAGEGGQGGPWRSWFDLAWFAPRAEQGLLQLGRATDGLDHHVDGLAAAWAAERAAMQRLPLQSPLAVEHHLSSPFGVRHDPFNLGLAQHEGIDLVAPSGSPILAAAAGVVVQADRMGPYGLAVDIDHGRGFTTRYAHASKLEVAVGDAVQAGQPIARVGSTGRSTAPHLHYEVRLNGQPIAPLADSVLKQVSTLAAQGQWSPTQPE